MLKRLKIIEEHRLFQDGRCRTTTHVESVCHDYVSARDRIAELFENRWREHIYPADCWVSECHPPEEDPETPWFSSKFPDEGEYRFRIEEDISKQSAS